MSTYIIWINPRKPKTALEGHLRHVLQRAHEAGELDGLSRMEEVEQWVKDQIQALCAQHKRFKADSLRFSPDFTKGPDTPLLGFWVCPNGGDQGASISVKYAQKGLTVAETWPRQPLADTQPTSDQPVGQDPATTRPPAGQPAEADGQPQPATPAAPPIRLLVGLYNWLDQGQLDSYLQLGPPGLQLLVRQVKGKRVFYWLEVENAVVACYAGMGQMGWKPDNPGWYVEPLPNATPEAKDRFLLLLKENWDKDVRRYCGDIPHLVHEAWGDARIVDRRPADSLGRIGLVIEVDSPMAAYRIGVCALGCLTLWGNKADWIIVRLVPPDEPLPVPPPPPTLASPGWKQYHDTHTELGENDKVWLVSSQDSKKEVLPARFWRHPDMGHAGAAAGMWDTPYGSLDALPQDKWMRRVNGQEDQTIKRGL